MKLRSILKAAAGLALAVPCLAQNPPVTVESALVPSYIRPYAAPTVAPTSGKSVFGP